MYPRACSEREDVRPQASFSHNGSRWAIVLCTRVPHQIGKMNILGEKETPNHCLSERKHTECPGEGCHELIQAVPKFLLWFLNFQIEIVVLGCFWPESCCAEGFLALDTRLCLKN